MKKIIVSLIFTAFTTFSFAQNIQIGGQAGLSFTNLMYASSNSEKITRVHLAFTTEYIFSKRFTLNGHFGYSGKGGGEFREGSGNDEIIYTGVNGFNIKLDFVNLGIGIRYYPLKESAKISPFATIGPTVGYIVSAKKQGEKLKGDDIKNRADVTTFVGLGIKLKLNNGLNIEILGGYDRGFNDVLSPRGPNGIGFQSLFNEHTFVTVGVKKSL